VVIHLYDRICPGYVLCCKNIFMQLSFISQTVSGSLFGAAYEVAEKGKV